jgi:hypothetical protein
MWQSFLENRDAIKAVYGDSIPELTNVVFDEIRIVNGEDLICYLQFTLKVLPEKMPEKWAARKVNSVQLNLSLTIADIVFFQASGGNIIGNVVIDSIGDSKQILFKVSDRDVFIIKTRFISIRSITGQCRNNELFL